MEALCRSSDHRHDTGAHGQSKPEFICRHPGARMTGSSAEVCAVRLADTLIRRLMSSVNFWFEASERMRAAVWE